MVDNREVAPRGPSPVWWLVPLLWSHYATLNLCRALINHRSNPVTFALFKKELQTLAFRKYNYLPLHISAALWAVYLTVFDYRLTFVLYFYFCQIELGLQAGPSRPCCWCWNSAVSKYGSTPQSSSPWTCHLHPMEWHHAYCFSQTSIFSCVRPGGGCLFVVYTFPNLCATAFRIIFPD